MPNDSRYPPVAPLARGAGCRHTGPDPPQVLTRCPWFLERRSTHQSSGFLFPSNPAPQPFTYQSGVGGVIKGWDDGVGTMQQGERAKITIPWQHAYGADGHPGFQIPGQ